MGMLVKFNRRMTAYAKAKTRKATRHLVKDAFRLIQRGFEFDWSIMLSAVLKSATSYCM
jgi:hypothetical protein